MKITAVNVYPVKGRHWPRFPMFFVEVETDAGIIGLGESLGYKASGIAQSIAEAGATLVGQDPRRIELIWQQLVRQGVHMAAISGIETALWDILGQSLNVPIYQLLGGQCHERIRVYADGFFRGADYVEEEYAAKAVAAVEAGLTALKMDVDEPIASGHSINGVMTSADLRLTEAMVRSVRQAVGADIDLCIDGHGAFDLPSALRLDQALRDYELLWIEDPLSMNNLKAMARVALESVTPICTGELLETRFAFRELFEAQAADIIMPDLARTGGIMELKKIAAAAETYRVPVAPHNMVGPVCTIASAHVCAATANFMILEYQLGDVAWIDELLDAPLQLDKGDILLSDKPGLGVKLNHAAVRKYSAA
ncbi:MAG: mandelate racemase/muconate lactonizing enzyme family protein [Caldilineaceae bacterium]|nr:mandelate racemase/muconate lactonizing enzyme family protein [Caldilineaceae bacterium]